MSLRPGVVAHDVTGPGRTRAILSDLKEAEALDIAMLSVALREIRNLSETGVAVAGAPAGG